MSFKSVKADAGVRGGERVKALISTYWLVVVEVLLSLQPEDCSCWERSVSFMEFIDREIVTYSPSPSPGYSAVYPVYAP